MKICLICPELGNPSGNAFIGGHANAVVRLSEELHRRNHNITIITTPHRYPGSEVGKNILSDWADVHTIDISAQYSSIKYGVSFARKSVSKVNALSKQQKFDVIHGHSGFSALALVTGYSASKLKVPAVHSLYSPIEVKKRSAVRLISNGYFSRFYFHQIDKIVAVSGNVKKSLINAHISKKKIIEVPVGVDTSIFNPQVSGLAIKKELEIGSNQTVLAYVGNLTKQKGLLVLIESMNILVKKHPQLKLIVALNMPLESYLNLEKLCIDMDLGFEIKNKIEQYGLEENIKLFGLRRDLPNILAVADIFITPFLDTIGIVDYPMSMVEAMALGKPVIATRVGGIPEIIKHKETGLLINPENVSELVEAVDYLALNKFESKRMGTLSAQTIAEQYSVKSEVDRLEQIYLEAIANHSGH
jgi:glycosyltransferase involved in cell wall biosynthesis